jgi:phospholipase B1
MISDGVNMDNDWKLLSIFVGGNDLCDFCGDVHAHSAANYSSNIEVLLVLRAV